MRAGETFGDVLRRERLAAELTQEELAERAGLSPRSVSDLERGINRTARKATAQLLADALGLEEPIRSQFVALARGRSVGAWPSAHRYGQEPPSATGPSAPAYLEVWRPAGPELVALTGPRVTIGKAPSNSVVVDHDRTVSRLHAVLEDYGAGWSVRDLGSRNGTYVNGEQIHTERALRPADEVRVGHSRLVFRDERLTGEALTLTATAEPAPELTERERDVLAALCRPFFSGEPFPQPAPTRRIALELVIADTAVEQHLLSLYGKFVVPAQGERRAALAEDAIRRGVVGPATVRRRPSPG
jgi:transcriptional regulator with XRE-family HTH domain